MSSFRINRHVKPPAIPQLNTLARHLPLRLSVMRGNDNLGLINGVSNKTGKILQLLQPGFTMLEVKAGPI